MYTLAIIEESMLDKKELVALSLYLKNQKTESVADDEFPIWHVNIYEVPDAVLFDMLPILEDQVKTTWYIHAFNENCLIVILYGKSFKISRVRDISWDAMIAYGESVDVERYYLENIPLNV